MKTRGAFAGKRCDIQIFLDIGGRAACDREHQLQALAFSAEFRTGNCI